ncbi:MAG: CehA/McbA family metallohydrolase [bacterium]|nr:CehA/McbA family metallohydrolase [bacterium]
MKCSPLVRSPKILVLLLLLVPAAAADVQRRMQSLIDALDAPAYAARVTWDEHVVLCYELVHDRSPTARELHRLRRYAADLHISPSTALSFVMRGSESHPTWGQCRDLLDRVRAADFRVDAAVRADALRLAALEPAPDVESPSLEQASEQPTHTGAIAHTRYETYFGYLHAHSELSDGSGSAQEAYTYARDVGGLDFFALTDHGELLAIWPWENKWDELRDAADAVDQPGAFVALWGFEWSHPLLGHVNVVGTQDYTHSLDETGLSDIYDWIASRPAAVGRFNHPGRYDDVGTEFLHLLPYPSVREQMVGIATWNKDDSFHRYYYSGGWTSAFSFWDEGNQQHWLLGALGGQDNHDADWGTRNDYRVAVLATELTREAILDAYRARRFYSTEDAGLFLDVRSFGRPMGSRLTGSSRRFDVRAFDAGGDAFEEVRLYRDGVVVETRAVAGPVVDVDFTEVHSRPAYYYVAVRQTDDEDGDGRNDEALSSPIWFD